MIDLHAHTNASDGTHTPPQLIEEAAAAGLEALGICDHDTFAGFEAAEPLAGAAGLELVRGIELSTRLREKESGRGKSVHVLGYFLDGPPRPEFRAWLAELLASRRERNARLAAKLQALGIQITLDEVEAVGRTLAGRPHFARLLVAKGYVSSIHEAFAKYLDESAQAYVQRREPGLEEGVGRIAKAGGLASLAHPVRIRRDPAQLAELLPELREHGLEAIEAYHSDHGPSETEQYLALARRYGLAVTGGSDFHGENKPAVRLGTGVQGNLAIPRSVLDDLRARVAQRT